MSCSHRASRIGVVSSSGAFPCQAVPSDEDLLSSGTVGQRSPAPALTSVPPFPGWLSPGNRIPRGSPSKEIQIVIGTVFNVTNIAVGGIMVMTTTIMMMTTIMNDYDHRCHHNH